MSCLAVTISQAYVLLYEERCAQSHVFVCLFCAVGYRYSQLVNKLSASVI